MVNECQSVLFRKDIVLKFRGVQFLKILIVTYKISAFELRICTYISEFIKLSNY